MKNFNLLEKRGTIVVFDPRKETWRTFNRVGLALGFLYWLPKKDLLVVHSCGWIGAAEYYKQHHTPD